MNFISEIEKLLSNVHKVICNLVSLCCLHQGIVHAIAISALNMSSCSLRLHLKGFKRRTPFEKHLPKTMGS